MHGSECVVALARAYFDESIAYKGRRILCVAGYLAKAAQILPFERKWGRILKRKNLPYFRMSACAHGNPPFDRLTKEERIWVATQMISNIKRRTKIGIAVTIDLDEYDRFGPPFFNFEV